MVILVIVLGGLTTIFVSGTSAEATLNRRFQAQQNARLALDRIRSDIHCAIKAYAQNINTYPGVMLADGSCFAATPTISWCVVPYSATPLRYQLFRTTTTGATACTGSDAARVLVADYLTWSSVFTTAQIPQFTLQAVGIDLRVSSNTTSSTADAYRLTDSIVAGNAGRCNTSGGCPPQTVP
jgi:Tfp pilus assembly protein PilW